MECTVVHRGCPPRESSCHQGVADGGGVFEPLIIRGLSSRISIGCVRASRPSAAIIHMNKRGVRLGGAEERES